MHNLVIPGLVGMAVLVLLLWPGRRQSRRGAWLAAFSAVAVAAGLWAVAIHVAGLPRAATPIPDQDALVHKVLAASEDEAYLESDELLRISLPQGRISARYPNGKYFRKYDLGVLTSLAAGRGTLLFTYHQGASKGGWAAIRGEAWLVEPHPSARGLTNASVFWDEQRGRFLLASFLEAESEAPELGDRPGLRVQPVALRSISPDGQVGDESTLRFLTSGAGFQGLCRLGGQLFAVDFAGRVCRLEENAAGASECRPLAGEQQERIACPGMPFGLAPHGVVTGQGVEAVPMPPKAFFGPGEPVPSSAFVQLGPQGPRPRFVWYTKDAAHVCRMGENSFSASFVDERVARDLGHVEHETLLALWDAQGDQLARRYIRRMTLPVLIFERGEEIVVLANDLSARVRLDKKTLARLDAPCPLAAARARLSVWGGPSLLFEGALAFGLLGILIVLLFAAGQLSRIGRAATHLTLQRVALVYLLVALPTLLDLVSRAWHL